MFPGTARREDPQTVAAIAVAVSAGDAIRGVRGLEVGEVALGVEGGRATGPGRGDRLPVDVVDEVAAGEDTLEVGLLAAPVDEDVPLVVEVDLAGEQLRPRVVTDRDEEPGGGQPRGSHRSRCRAG